MTAELVTDQRDRQVQMQHALVWDLDRRVVDRVATALRHHGHNVHAVSDDAEAWRCLEDHNPDITVLAVGGDRGPGVVRSVRAGFPGPLVCYSDTAGTDARIEVLSLGADDVVPSPVSYRELALRVRAVARRRDAADSRPVDDTEIISCGPLTADPGTHQILRDDDWVQLTAVEFSLLAFLMRNPRTSFTRRQLLRQVWGYEIGDTSTVSVHVRRLRRKLERDPAEPTLIRTVWGSGYYFEPSDS